METDGRLRFTEIIEQLKELAELQGRFLTIEQVQDAFLDIPTALSQMDLIYDYLKKERIGVGERINSDDFCSPQELNYLELYLKELSELPQYTDGQKKAIYVSAMQQDSDAVNGVINIFLPRVPEIAKLYAGQGVSIEELIGEGNVALTVAAGMLSSQESYEDVDELLAQMVMNAMEELLEQTGKQAKADDAMLRKINTVMEAAKDIYESYLRKATMEEVAKETGISIKTIKEIDLLCDGAIEYMESECKKEEK